ncbi:hypothetical protein TNCV_1274281 [Trichonephila clavipes]|nr:hypothetical protein TNCV_1274281 [Trichonephila clavipes]
MWRGDVPGRNGRSALGDISPGRTTLGVKAIPLYPAKTAGEGAESAFYLLVLRSLLITEAAHFSSIYDFFNILF